MTIVDSRFGAAASNTPKVPGHITVTLEKPATLVLNSSMEGGSDEVSSGKDTDPVLSPLVLAGPLTPVSLAL